MPQRSDEPRLPWSVLDTISRALNPCLARQTIQNMALQQKNALPYAIRTGTHFVAGVRACSLGTWVTKPACMPRQPLSCKIRTDK